MVVAAWAAGGGRPADKVSRDRESPGLEATSKGGMWKNRMISWGNRTQEGQMESILRAIYNWHPHV